MAWNHRIIGAGTENYGLWRSVRRRSCVLGSRMMAKDTADEAALLTMTAPNSIVGILR